MNSLSFVLAAVLIGACSATFDSFANAGYTRTGGEQPIPARVNDTTVRQYFSVECEKRLNEQIKYEFFASQIYLSMSTYLSQWNVSLPGFAKKFRAMSDEEREHGTKLLEYINKRGGVAKVPLNVDISPYRQQVESNDWTDIMTVLKTALRLERFVNEKLVDHVRTCRETQNFHMEDFIDSVYLTEQVDSIHELGKIITEVNMIGTSHFNNYGLYQYDKQFL